MVVVHCMYSLFGSLFQLFFDSSRGKHHVHVLLKKKELII